MKLLCIDFGLRRIGIAVGSNESGIAFPRDLVLNDEHTFTNLNKIIVQEKIGRILIGLPRKHDQSDGDIVHKLRQFSDRLSKESGLSIEFLNERFTSKIAASKLQQVGIKAKDQKPLSDSIAAQVMLQEYLEQSYSTLNPKP